MLNFHIIKADYLYDYKIKFEFADHSIKYYDFEQDLNENPFNALKDLKMFKNFNLSNHTITWCNGDLDFAPETIYNRGSTALL